MHKDYFEHGHNNILKFFSDRIQIENIWLKPRNFVLGKTIFRRNQLIADLFARIHFGEKLGSGMQRMRDICKSENAPYPRIEFTDTHFYIIFKQSREYLKLAGRVSVPEVKEKLGEKLGENQFKIISFIKEDKYITTKELAEKIGISTTAIDNNIAKLKQKELLKRIGPAKGGYWKVLARVEK